ncbi:hypothetical protein DASC09_054590 [Saccharomycopsis crataegensis]|uniref:Uncharacterized protein n=1 Tax=Saccharomycopsis crataegensis TaxID=43959 RepID=A0AAV5QTP9_9ASCO|nr:hypothetical protein DASC09_054590 [Saccharomycopsis crataegensis]
MHARTVPIIPVNFEEKCLDEIVIKMSPEQKDEKYRTGSGGGYSNPELGELYEKIKAQAFSKEALKKVENYKAKKGSSGFKIIEMNGKEVAGFREVIADHFSPTPSKRKRGQGSPYSDATEGQRTPRPRIGSIDGQNKNDAMIDENNEVRDENGRPEVAPKEKTTEWITPRFCQPQISLLTNLVTGIQKERH